MQVSPEEQIIASIGEHLRGGTEPRDKVIKKANNQMPKAELTASIKTQTDPPPKKQLPGKENKTQESRIRFEFIHNAQIIEKLRPIQWRISGIMEDDTLYNDFGDVASFKTFVAIDRGLCIASGIDYHGHPVKQGSVFYIPGEGQQGLGRRIAAWHISHGTKASEVPFFVSRAVTNLMDPKAIDDVKRAIDKMVNEFGPPAMVHLDTLSRNFGPGDENATKDMNRAINNLTHSFGTDIIRGITHHTGHLNKERARGSIALRAACDHEYRITYQPNTGKVLIECKKMKDALLAPPMLFTPKEIPLQIGDEKSSSLVLELDSEGDEVPKLSETNQMKMSRNMQAALSLLKEMYAEYEKNLESDGRAGQSPHVSVNDWKAQCMDRKIYARTDGFHTGAKRMFLRGSIVYDANRYHVYPIEICHKYNLDQW